MESRNGELRPRKTTKSCVNSPTHLWDQGGHGQIIDGWGEEVEKGERESSCTHTKHNTFLLPITHCPSKEGEGGEGSKKHAQTPTKLFTQEG